VRINPRAEVWVGGGLALVAILVQPGVALAAALGWKLSRTQETDLLVLTVAGISVGVLMVLHGFGLFAWIPRIRFQSPITLTPVSKTSVLSAIGAPTLPLPNPVTVSKPKPARVYADVSTAKLVELAKTPNLTTAQTAALIEPYFNMWLAIEGDVNNVNPPNQVVVQEGDAASSPLTCAYFGGGFNPRSLQKGEHVRLFGRISGVTLGMVQLQDCELSKPAGLGA
jgi:hypothetical protein